MNAFRKIFAQVPNEYRAQFADRRLQVNVGRSHALSLYMIIVQIILNLINIIKPSEGEGGDIFIYIALSMTTLGIGLIYWVLLFLVKKEKIRGRGIKILLTQSLLYIYLIIQLVFCYLNIINSGGVNSYIIALLIVSLFPILPPAQSITTIVLSFAYLLISMYMARSVSDAWNAILVTDTWANLVIITGITIFASVIIHNLFVSDFLQTMRLQERNQDLQMVNGELEQLNSQLEQMATTDQMTGMANRYAFSRDFVDIWNAAAEKQKRMAMAIMDIDFFKAYNDKYGHLEGDKCLQQVAASLKNSFRRSDDIVVRFGGEEFLAVFSADRADAWELAEKARNNVEALNIPHATDAISPYVTISIGVCVAMPDPAISTDMVLHIADDALYEAKRTGRNRSVLRIYEKEDE